VGHEIGNHLHLMMGASNYIGAGRVVYFNEVDSREVTTGLQLNCRRVGIR